ncbi:NAD(P)H-hydrate epimerase [Pseudooceanicola onchidii]|uniref:NAD(P)H-hydrate epimerase n=1 Tax=Pseudooceanicola onchidii TaxID=2562279 RepID=UPI0030B88164
MLTSQEMRDAEARAIDSGSVTGTELMERAGAGVVQALMDRWPGWDGISPSPCAGQLVLVLCGPGNNGGDGYVVARLLAEAGADVRVLAYGDPAALSGDALRARRLWGGTVQMLDASGLVAVAEQAVSRGQDWLVVIDALFGIGQRAPLDPVTEPVGDLVDHMLGGAGPTPFFVAIDLPTGYDADTGATLCRRPLSSDLTVTFHQPKPIHGMPHFLDTELVVVDIGL